MKQAGYIGRLQKNGLSYLQNN